MMLVSINRNNGTVSVVSFPRDLYVTIPGWMTNRLNTAFAAGGFDTMAYTFEYNFGVRPTYYVMTNFDGFKSIIDTLGGITIEASQDLYDKCDVSWRDWQGYCYVPAGSFTLDGESALWYVRSRYSSSDFDRLRRAQEVMKGIFVKLMSLNGIARAPELYENFRSSVETNLGIDDILGLLPVASAVLNDSGRVYQYAITPAQASPYVTPEGAYVLWPDLFAIQAIVREAMYR
jgi:LCP family protein required for cell wall assembly